MNPIVQRFRESQRRKGTGVIFSVLYAVVLLFFCVWAYPDEHLLQDERISRFATILYAQLWLTLVLLFVWASVQAGREIPQEVERKSYDFFRLLPLPPRTKVLGIVWGVNRPLFVIMAVNLALMTVLVPMSSTSIGGHLQLSLVTVCVGTCLLFLSFLLSTLGHGLRKMKSARLMRLLLVAGIALMSLPMLLTATFKLADGGLETLLAEEVGFFRGAIPWSVFLTLSFGYLAAWGYAACLRRFRAEAAPVVPRGGGVVFLVGASVFALALGWPRPNDFGLSSHGRMLGIVGISAIGLVLTTAASFLSVVDYLEGRKRLGQPLSKLWFRLSNLTTAALFLSVVGGTWLLLALLQRDVGHALAAVSAAVVTVAFLALLLEWHALREERAAHPALLTGFLIFCFAVFPLIASASTDAPVYVLSSLDYFFVIVWKPQVAVLHLSSVLAINVGYCAVLGALIARDYARLGKFAERLD